MLIFWFRLALVMILWGSMFYAFAASKADGIPTYQQYYSCLGALQAQSDINRGNVLSNGSIFPQHNENISIMFDKGEELFKKEEREIGIDVFVDAIAAFEKLSKKARKKTLIKCYHILNRVK